MNYAFKYLSHLLTATNQHGVHSPFVYDYVTKCLYEDKRFSKKKTINILLKSIAYFNVRTLLLPTEKNELKKLALQNYPELQFGRMPCDMALFSAPNSKNMVSIYLADNKIHNDTVGFVDNIHASKKTESAWRQLQENKKVTVTIDLFYCGIVFFRKEQAKEHFKIRI